MNKGRNFLFLLLVLAVLFARASICASDPLMVDKNLFSQDRKPPSPEPAASAAQQNTQGIPPKAIQLDGIMIRGDTKKALLRIKGQTSQSKERLESPFITVQEGEKISDYQVTNIGPRSISLERAGQVYDVSLYAQGKILPPMPPAPPPPQPAGVGAPEDQAAPPDTARTRRRVPPHLRAGRGNEMPASNNPNVAVSDPAGNQPADSGEDMATAGEGEDDAEDAEEQDSQ